jgi:hypothetical protein
MLALSCLLFLSLSVEAAGQQNQPNAPLVFTIQMQEGSTRVHLALRNPTTIPVQVLLGLRDNTNEMLDAISLLIVDESGTKIPAVLIGHVLGGNVGPVDEVIAPGREWQTDMKLDEFMLFEDPANPLPANQLPAGSYTVYGVFKGESGDWVPQHQAYWVGTIRSAPVRYVISK